MLDAKSLTDLEVFRHPEAMRTLASLGGFGSANANLRRWADGIYGSNGYDRAPTSVFRLHRDGSAGLGVAFHGESLHYLHHASP